MRLPFTKRKKYRLPYTIKYYSVKYAEHVTVPEGYESDGATGAMDIWTESFWVHDLLCERHTWDSGAHCTSKQAAEVLADILWREKRYLRSLVWYLAVRCFGPRF